MVNVSEANWGKPPEGNSSGPTSALRALCSLMDPWLFAWINHKTIMVKKSRLQQIRRQIPVHLSPDDDCLSLSLSLSLSICFSVCLSTVEVHTGATQPAVNHSNKSEHGSYYITCSSESRRLNVDDFVMDDWFSIHQHVGLDHNQNLNGTPAKLKCQLRRLEWSTLT